MKINFVVHSLDLSNMGGVIKVVSDLSNKFVELNVDVTIYSIGPINELCFKLKPNIKIISLNIDKYSTSKYKGLSKLNWFMDCNSILFEIVNSKTNEIWMPTSPPLNLLFSIFKFKNNNIKIVGCEHTSTIYKKGVVIDGMKYFLLKKIDCIVALTEEDKDFYLSKGVRSITIPNPIDFSSIEMQGNKRKNIIFVGRFSEEKQPLLTIDFFYRSQLWKKNINLKMYGFGSLENEILNLIKSYNLEEYVTIIKGERDPKVIYKDAIFLLMTSKVEGFPMVLLEALSRNIPCISYDCPYGPRNIIKNGENGFLISDFNDFSYDKVFEIVNRNNLDLRKSITKFDINIIVGQFIDLFREILK